MTDHSKGSRERVPQGLATAVLRTPGGEAAALAEAWKERPAVLAFVRHFG